MNKECPTCHRPFDKRGMHCASCGRPIKKNHKWRIDHSTVRHQDCRNVRMVPLCQSTFNTLDCVLELANHPLHHTSARGVTWSVHENEFDGELYGGKRGGGMTAMVLDGLCATGGYAGVVRADSLIEALPYFDAAYIRVFEDEINTETGIMIDTAENEGMILRERGE